MDDHPLSRSHVVPPLSRTLYLPLLPYGNHTSITPGAALPTGLRIVFAVHVHPLLRRRSTNYSPESPPTDSAPPSRSHLVPPLSRTLYQAHNELIDALIDQDSTFAERAQLISAIAKLSGVRCGGGGLRVDIRSSTHAPSLGRQSSHTAVSRSKSQA